MDIKACAHLSANSKYWQALCSPFFMTSRPMGYLHDFRSIAPRYRAEQSKVLEWLAEAHALAELETQGLSPEDPKAASIVARTQKRVQRFGCSTDRIQFRNSALVDFTHTDWDQMKVYALREDPAGRGADARSRLFSEVANEVFEKFYAEESTPPPAIIHVTCTGYVSPSGAQRLVSNRAWGETTEVLHAYHMGCYASLPAIRMAGGLLSMSRSSVDIVHTELCTLHLNPTQREPEQLVVQTLFADGLIRYKMSATTPTQSHFEVLATREEIISDTLDEMSWMASDHGMQMTLSRQIADKIGTVLNGYLERLFAKASLDFATQKDGAWFVIHPGGPRIIDQIQKLLELKDSQVQASNDILRNYGNMSSATLPHIWNHLLLKDDAHSGDLVVSMAFGPGLTISGAILKLQKPDNTA